MQGRILQHRLQRSARVHALQLVRIHVKVRQHDQYEVV